MIAILIGEQTSKLVFIFGKMLQIINANSPDVTLNNWEKTSPIIKELEQTVDFAERKYGDLMQQLNFYKIYWSQHEKFSNKSEIRIQRKTKKKSKTKNVIVSNSSSDIENVNLEPQRINQHFYEKLKNKISKINNEITEANKKLGLKPAEETRNENHEKLSEDPHFKKEEEEFPSKVTKSEPTMTAEKKSSSDKICQKSSTKSIPFKNFKKRHVPAFRRRHSSLQPYKLRSKSLPQGVRRKFGFGSFVDVADQAMKKLSSEKIKNPKVELIKKPSFKIKKNFSAKINKSNVEIPAKKEIPRRKTVSQNNIPFNLSEVKSQNKITPSCKNVIEDVKEDINVLEKQNRNFNRKPSTIVTLAKQPIPFTICGSTSKSFNLGLNIQQVLSMVKHKKHSVTLQEILKDNIRSTCSVLDKTEPEVNTLFVKSQIGSEICPAREDNDDCLSCITDARSRCTIVSKAQTSRSRISETKIKSLTDPNSIPKLEDNLEKIERPEDVWVVEQPDSNSNFRRTKSKCTCFPSKQCMDYNKVLKQYTGWRLPITKSDILNSEFCGTRFTLSTCNGSQLYPIPSQENIYQNPKTISGNQNGVKAELIKLYNDLMNLHRKYASLQEQIALNNLDDLEAQTELDAMESEINARETEYKNIINFYSQLLSLKERLKFLRGKNNGSISLSVIQHRPRKDPLRPTPSMALTKVLRQIQCLQDKIKLTDTP